MTVLFLGARLGKYDPKKSNEFKPHSFALSTFGVFFLWFGWFGFNGGSVLSADPAAISLVFVTTCLGGAAGTMAAMFISWYLNKRPDLANTLNGCLAGLVGITASADQIGPMGAVIIGGIAGILVVFSARFFESKRIDDPVGAISVHLVCGVWGTLAVGLFGELASVQQLVSQAVGIVAIGAFTVLFSVLTLSAIKAVMGLRVGKSCEEAGLDFAEHKDRSYIYHPEHTHVPEPVSAA